LLELHVQLDSSYGDRIGLGIRSLVAILPGHTRPDLLDIRAASRNSQPHSSAGDTPSRSARCDRQCPEVDQPLPM
jgi:hypothetical protein